MNLRQAAQQALEALVTCCAEEWRTLNNFGMKQVYDEKKVNAAIAALHAALAEPDINAELVEALQRYHRIVSANAIDLDCDAAIDKAHAALAKVEASNGS